MSIWFRSSLTLADAQRELARGGELAAHLDIRLEEVGSDYLRGSMPVDARTIQPFGLLHGGASLALAETLGCAAAACCIDTTRQRCRAQEVSANHLRPVRSGRVAGTARPVHLGGRSHVWDVRIEDEAGRLTCISRLTVAITTAAGNPDGTAAARA